MPFTFAHPAIILPLSYLPKRWFSLTGLIIGSVTPDFEYFLRMNVQSIYSHTFWGVFWFDLPLGILLAFIFHNIVRNPFYENLPLFLKSRFIKFLNFNFNLYFKKNWIIVLISILIGAFSHMLWDSFTHESGYSVSVFPFLSASIFLFQYQIPIYKILQHSSTLLGAMVILITVFNLEKDKKSKSTLSFKYWLIVLLIFASVILLRLATGLNYRLYGQVIVTAISAFLIAIICTPSLLYFRRKVEFP